ncbi:hypothetical protein ALQ57_01137 [Pseudomonas amygdali pv. hibisci]|uniref:Uncharacterized protein n=1 Tax=Pseudomonas amygdali pv. hibisci TaxID=251723 RepID=A0AB34U8K5_PSEA0|nr:Uncharacterized protein ALO67_03947 [Pseudomonas amygdali pv. hibisci]RMN58651.1 hypothetical protein ALQ57_01137 [Pseudomonas amygdali pv. hibisci]
MVSNQMMQAQMEQPSIRLRICCNARTQQTRFCDINAMQVRIVTFTKLVKHRPVPLIELRINNSQRCLAPNDLNRRGEVTPKKRGAQDIVTGDNLLDTLKVAIKQ